MNFNPASILLFFSKAIADLSLFEIVKV